MLTINNKYDIIPIVAVIIYDQHVVNSLIGFKLLSNYFIFPITIVYYGIYYGIY